MIITKPRFPKITIITVSLNAAVHLEEAICSILESGYPALEYIGVDGNSSDGSVQIWMRYIDRLSWFCCEPDRGISDAFNKGIAHATGEIIGIVSADDVLLPGALEMVAECYIRNDCPDIIYGDVIFVDQVTGERTVSKPKNSLRSFWFGQPIKHGGTFISREAYERLGLYDLRYCCAMDYDLTLRFWVKGSRFVYLPYQLELIRTGGVNMRLRSRTRIESREISILNGCSIWKAWMYWSWKVIKDATKNALNRMGLRWVLRRYQYVRNQRVIKKKLG